MRCVRIVGARCGPFDIALVDGPDDAFANAIASRAELPADGFYLTASADGPVVPLTAKLPEDVTELHLHLLAASRVSNASDKPVMQRRHSISVGEEVVEWTTPRKQKAAVVARWRATFRKSVTTTPPVSGSERLPTTTTAAKPYPVDEASHQPASASTQPPGSVATSFKLNDPLVGPHWGMRYTPSNYGVEARRVPKSGYSEIIDEMLNLLSAFVLSLCAMVTYYSIIGCVVATVATWLYWEYAIELAVKLDWNIISLAVILPTSQGISMGYKRREQCALLLLSLWSNRTCNYILLPAPTRHRLA